MLHLQATDQRRVCPIHLRELLGRIILRQEAPTTNVEEGAYLPSGALSPARILAHGEEAEDEKEGE